MSSGTATTKAVAQIATMIKETVGGVRRRLRGWQMAKYRSTDMAPNVSTDTDTDTV